MLLIEADQSLRTLLCRVLQENGYLVHEASQRQEALAELHREHPDLVLLGSSRAVPSDFELYQELRCHTQAPIIMSSTWPQREHTRYIEPNTNDTYIPMPFRAQQLMDCISLVLQATTSNALQLLPHN
ncbi:MAG: response regulator [Caldilineaceae bacterium]